MLGFVGKPTGFGLPGRHVRWDGGSKQGFAGSSAPRIHVFGPIICCLGTLICWLLRTNSPYFSLSMNHHEPTIFGQPTCSRPLLVGFDLYPSNRCELKVGIAQVHFLSQWRSWDSNLRIGKMPSNKPLQRSHDFHLKHAPKLVGKQTLQWYPCFLNPISWIFTGEVELCYSTERWELHDW